MSRRLASLRWTFGLLTVLILGCSGGSGNSVAPGTPTAINVTLVDGPAPDFKEVNLSIKALEIHASATPGESGWITLATPNKTVDLLKLRDGVVETLAAGKSLDPGRYQMLRLILAAAGNTIKLADGSSAVLEIPSGQQSGLKLPLSFTVAPGTTADVWIDFDGARSIHLIATGGPIPRYILRPVVQAVEKVATGSVTGTLKSGATLLANAQVLAETLDANGNVTILRSATTNASGAYALGLLPLNQSFYLVAQPEIGTMVYQAQASGAMTLSAGQPTAVWNGTGDFVAATAVGGATGTLLPTAAANQGDVVHLLASLPTGLSGTLTLAIATANGVVAGGETYAFARVPAGSYRVQGLRTTLNADGSTTLARTAQSPLFSINNGATTPQNLTF